MTAAAPNETLIDPQAARYDAWDRVQSILEERMRPPSNRTGSQWADAERILPDTSPAPGKWRTSAAPYLREPMDVCTDPETERVVFMKGAQVGYSEMLNNIMGYFIHEDPATILFVHTSIKEAERYSKERIAPLIEKTPVLRSRVAPAKSRDSENTIDSKKFAGGHLGIVGANAPTGLRSRPRRILLLDEVDGYPPSAGDEGDPVDLATKRTIAFFNRLIVMGSTPTLKDFSRIEHAFLESDQRYYHVPCPHCGHGQRLIFPNLKWDKDEDGRHMPETAAYMCESCGALIEERHKRQMVTDGEWVKTNPSSRIAGFHLSALYPLWVRWEHIADEFLKAQGNPEKLQVWVNTSCGETFDEKGTTLDAGPLVKRREDYDAEPLPERVVLLTAGVDVQADRLELEIVGWAPGEESWSLEYLRIPGDPSVGSLWKHLEHVLGRTWRHPQGVRLRLAAACIDSQYMTQQVLKFCKGRGSERVWPIQGRDGMGRPIWDRASRRNKQKVAKYPVGVDTAKGVFYARLGIDEPKDGEPCAGYCHFPKCEPYDERYFSQLTSEKIVSRRTNRGFLKRQWVRRPGRNAEALDCRIYAHAALEGLQLGGLRLDKLADDMESGGSPKKGGRRIRSKGVAV